ncbi:MAG: glycosyltransferase family 39 protein [Saprospiraceae bacterium]
MAKTSGSKKSTIPKPTAKRGNKKSSLGVTGIKGAFITKWPLVLLVTSAIIVLQARLQLLAIPMERDEAGFAYIGHWLLKGKSLYIDMVDNKLPGLYMLYGFFTTIFGYNATGVHLGLLLANVVTALLFYLLIRDLYNQYVAETATAFLIILLADPNVLGFAAHATQLLLPFVMGGFYFFWKGIRTERIILFFLSGLLLGSAFIIKQQSIVFGVLAALIWWPARIFWNRKEQSRLPLMEWIALGSGGIIPVFCIAGYFKFTGRWEELFFWSVKQPSRMTSTFTNSRWELFGHFVPLVTKHFEILWITALAGFVLIFFSTFRKSALWFGLLLASFGLISVVIGAAFYQHYFILALPGVALLSAVMVYWISGKPGKFSEIIGGCIALLILLLPVISEKEYFFYPDPVNIHQRFYGINMFPELERIGKELSNRVPEGSRIGVMGSEPEVLVAADREGCSKHLFMYPILSDPELSPPLQDEYVNEIESCSPEYIVWNLGVLSWAAGYDKLQFFGRFMNWVEQYYTTYGIAEFRKDQPGEIVWGDQLPSFHSQNDFKVYIFKRK